MTPRYSGQERKQSAHPQAKAVKDFRQVGRSGHGSFWILRVLVRYYQRSCERFVPLGVSLDSVVIACQEGHFPETIQQLYPALSLEEV